MTAPLFFTRLAGVLALPSMLAACSPDPTATVPTAAEPPSTTQNSATPAPASAASPSLVPAAGLAVPDVTVNALMKDSIEPAARKLWNAVSYVVSETGTQETSPQSNADWNALRDSADVLMKTALTLQLPGLRIHADPDAERPDFQFSPEEIEARLSANPAPWRSYAQHMQTTTLQILGAIERRDLIEYTTMGVTLNEACEGCHAEYWYRPLPMRGAEGLR